jgi:hypothetical protein
MIRIALLAGVTLVLGAQPLYAQASDPNMTCADYLKVEAAAGPTPSTGDAATDKMAADMDKKMKDYCTAHPKDKASDAAMKVMGG